MKLRYFQKFFFGKKQFCYIIFTGIFCLSIGIPTYIYASSNKCKVKNGSSPAVKEYLSYVDRALSAIDCGEEGYEEVTMMARAVNRVSSSFVKRDYYAIYIEELLNEFPKVFIRDVDMFYNKANFIFSAESSYRSCSQEARATYKAITSDHYIITQIFISVMMGNETYRIKDDGRSLRKPVKEKIEEWIKDWESHYNRVQRHHCLNENGNFSKRMTNALESILESFTNSGSLVEDWEVAWHLLMQTVHLAPQTKEYFALEKALLWDYLVTENGIPEEKAGLILQTLGQFNHAKSLDEYVIAFHHRLSYATAWTFRKMIEDLKKDIWKIPEGELSTTPQKILNKHQYAQEFIFGDSDIKQRHRRITATYEQLKNTLGPTDRNMLALIIKLLKVHIELEDLNQRVHVTEKSAKRICNRQAQDLGINNCDNF